MEPDVGQQKTRRINEDHRKRDTMSESTAPLSWSSVRSTFRPVGCGVIDLTLPRYMLLQDVARICSV
jgi:hypothetical protein